MGVAFCSGGHRTKPTGDYFSSQQAFDEPVCSDSDHSSYDLDNMSFVSHVSERQKKEGNCHKLSDSSGILVESISSHPISVSPRPIKVQNKRKKNGEMYLRPRTRPIKVRAEGINGLKVKIGLNSMESRRSISSYDSSSGADLKGSIKSILEPLVNEKTDNALDKDIDEMFTNLISNFKSWEKRESVVLKKTPHSVKKLSKKKVERRQASCNGRPLPSNNDFLSHVFEDPNLKVLDKSNGFEEQLENMRGVMRYSPLMFEIVNLRRKINELNSKLSRLQLQSVDLFCQNNSELLQERSLIEKQLKDLKKQLSTALCDIQVNLLTGFNLDYVEKWRRTNSPLLRRASIRNKRDQSESLEIKYPEEYRTEASIDISLSPAIHYRKFSSQSQSPKSLNFDNSVRISKILGRSIDNNLLKIDEDSNE